MSVTEVKEGLRVEEVYDDSPAKEGGLKAGDMIVCVNGKSLAGKTSDQSTALIKGPAGSHGDARRAQGRGASAHAQAREGRHPDRRRAEIEARATARRSRWVRAGRASRRARARTSRRRSTSELGKGAKGIVLDLRHNGGGLLNEAVSVASVFLARRPRRLDQGPRAAGARLQRRGRRDPGQDPGRRARRRGLGLGVGDRHRRAAGPQAREGRRHAHVRQGRLPGDRAAAPTAARWTSPSASTSRRPGRNLGGGGVRKGAGITPDIKAVRRSRRPSQGRGAATRRWRRWPGVSVAPLVGVLEKHGAHLRGRAVLRARPAGSTSTSRAAASASATSCRSRPARAARARIERRIGRPGRRARRARRADGRTAGCGGASIRWSSARRGSPPRTSAPGRSGATSAT